jgi:hypothetical protein
MSTDRWRLRLAAVGLAVRIDGNELGPRRVGIEQRTREALEAADEIYAWVTEPAPVARLVGRIGPLTPITQGDAMSNPQIPVGYSFPITIEPEDTQGNAVGDTLTWSSSDAAAAVAADATTLIGTVAVLTPATSVIVTATDGTNSFEYTFDAVVDAPVTLVGTVGVPTKTPAAPAA